MKYDFDLIIEDDNSLSKIIKQIERNSVVLEFGPAAGRMTRYLKQHLNCKVYIVEIDNEAAKKAAVYAEDFIVGDIESYIWLEKWEAIHFDYIVFADVLEHLRNPQKVLAKTKLLLKEEGKTILSVPNVGHNSILINLINNIFNYMPTGLLDDTHIHLFAYNTLVAFCSYAGYIPIIEDAVYANVGENEIPSSYDQISKAFQRELKKRIYNNVYQYVFTLQKKSYVNMHSVTIEKKIIPYTLDYKFKVYFDKGNGWLEENSVSINFKPNGEHRFIIPVTQNELIKEIRIDPIDCAYGVRLKKLVSYKKNGKELLDVKMASSNAKIQMEQSFLFETDDPNIFIKGISWKGVCELEILVEYEELPEMAMELLEELYVKSEPYKEELNRQTIEMENRMALINSLNRKIQEDENTIKLQKEELDRRAVELENRMALINSLNCKIQEVVCGNKTE